MTVYLVNVLRVLRLWWSLSLCIFLTSLSVVTEVSRFSGAL